MIVGVDTGGTFTDFVVMDDGRLRVHKEPSTPDNPARAVLSGLENAELVASDVVHGSTVATNALLERRGARTALITTAGFEDLLDIGRQARREIYAIDVDKPEPLVARDDRHGLRERIGPEGEVVRELDESSLREVVEAVLGGGDLRAVAICLLHSYANPEHERRVVVALEERGFDGFVSASHRVLPEFREYERANTTVANAYVGPVMDRYLAYLRRELGEARVRIMQSNGGSISLEAARRESVQTILSGPAGGVVGGFEISRRAGYPDCITFDMGGTSTDVSLCRGAPMRTPESDIGGLPIRLPVIDIHTVGAGGGSIAYKDPGGALRVGPRSAGAEPGPICYGRGGEEVTVTDANLFLGRLSADHFLGGAQKLAMEPARERIEELAGEFDMSPVELAEGVVRVANTTMEGAIRVISVERGFDPRDFALVSFGGAGSMHAVDLARSLAIPRVIVPRAAGILSALGMLLADFIRDYSQTLLIPSRDAERERLEEEFDKLRDRALREYADEGVDEDRIRFEMGLDMRYVGQGYELELPYREGWAERFHEVHGARYGYSDPDRPTEIVNIRLRAIGETDKPQLRRRDPGGPDASAAVLGDHEMVFSGETVRASLVDRERLRAGHRFDGPALVVEYSTTTVLPPGSSCQVDEWQNLVVETGDGGAGR